MKRAGLLLLLFSWFLIAGNALAQFDSAEVLGTVKDKSGAVIPGVSVMLLNQDTGIQSKTVTAENGNYDMVNVKIGRYSITAERAGFRKFETKDVAVNVNAR